MRTKHDDFVEECKLRHQIYEEMIAGELDRYTQEELDEIEVREAYFQYGEYDNYPNKNRDFWNGMISKMYDEGITGDMVIYHANDCFKTRIPKLGDKDSPDTKPWIPPVPDITMEGHEISDYKLLRRNIRMMKHSPGGLKNSIKPPPGAVILPNIKLHPRVEEVMKSLLEETMQKQKKKNNKKGKKK